MRKQIISFSIILTALFFNYTHANENELSEIEQKNQRNMNFKDRVVPSSQYKTYDEATNNENVENWNTKDFQKNQGGNTGMIGSTQIFLGQTPGAKEAYNSNPNEMTTQGIQDNPALKDIESLNAWNQDLQEHIISGALAATNQISTTAGTVKCYITRNIPIKYWCSSPDNSFVYGETMGGNGLQAKQECENECTEQYGCASLIENPISETINIESIEINTFTKNEINEDVADDKLVFEQSIVKDLNIEQKITSISFKAFGSDKIKGKKSFIDISYINKKGIENILLKKMLINESDEPTLNINDFASSIEIKVYTNDKEVHKIISDIKINYGSNQKYICTKYQDVSTKNPGDFAHLCPSGNLIDFHTPTSSYKICADYGVVGDHSDGTFSSEEACLSICKKQYSCYMDTTSFNTDILHEFQEGCIEGQTNCEENTCRDLRLNGNRVLNENVFKAGANPIHTIVNSTQQQSVERPRPILEEDMNYLKRNAEEWKDAAYLYMLTNQTFAQSTVTFDQNTEMSLAYNIGQIEGANYGQSVANSRALYAILKPKAYDVHNNTSYKFYVIVDAVVERNEMTQDLTLKKTKDRILYARTTNESDIFIPFAVKRNYAQNLFYSDDNEDFGHADYEASNWEYQNFNGENWHYHSSINLLPNYKNEELILGDRPYMRIKAIDNLNNVFYSLPGLVRSISTNGLYTTKNYTGDFDGTGDSLARFAVYFYYGNQDITYFDIVEMIENQEIKPFYDNLSASAYSKTVKNDNGSINAPINIYQYGPINKKSAYIRIFPKETEVGKKGFIYVFGY